MHLFSTNLQKVMCTGTDWNLPAALGGGCCAAGILLDFLRGFDKPHLWAASLPPLTTTTSLPPTPLPAPASTTAAIPVSAPTSAAVTAVRRFTVRTPFPVSGSGSTPTAPFGSAAAAPLSARSLARPPAIPLIKGTVSRGFRTLFCCC